MILCGSVARMRGIPPFGENKKAPGGWKNPVPGADGRAFAVVSPEVGHTGPTAAVSFLRGVGLPLGENGAYWGGQVAHSLFTIWERMGRQTHPSYQCETYAFFFLLASGFPGRSNEVKIFFPAGKKTRGRGAERGEAAYRCLPFRSRFCSTKPAPQKGALPPWKGNLWSLPRLLGNLYRKPQETFTQLPAGKRGENKKAGPFTWDEPGKRPRQMGKSD